MAKFVWIRTPMGRPGAQLWHRHVAPMTGSKPAILYEHPVPDAALNEPGTLAELAKTHPCPRRPDAENDG